MAGKIWLPWNGVLELPLSSIIYHFCITFAVPWLLTVSQEGVKLPPEPPGHCSKELQVTNPFKSSKGHVTRHVASSCQESCNL